MIKYKKNEDEVSVLKWALIRFFISLAAALVSVGIFLALTKEEAKEGKQEATAAAVTNQELIEAIVESCEDNGNPLREVLQNSLQREIAQAKNTELYRQFFPDVDPKELDRVIAKQVKIAQRELRRIEPVNCKNQYPKK